MSIIQELTKNVLKVSYESLDNDTVENAKLRVIDVIGCAISGANAAGCKKIVDLVKEWGGKEESSILIYGTKIPAHNAAMVNSVMCRSYDFEPVEACVAGKNIPSHISGSTIPTAISMAEWKGTSGKELITALVLGDDLASRILAASRFSFDSGWETNGTVNMFGTTAIAGRLLGLSQSQLINAFGIALNQMAGTFQNLWDWSLSFKLPMAFSSRNGIFSAELAKRGFTGLKDPLLSERGYFKLYYQGYDPNILTQDLGKKFYSDRTFKPYPACRFTHGAIECALKITRQQDIDTDNIREVRLGVTDTAAKAFVSQSFKIDKFPQVPATFSFQYTTASTLLRKDIKIEYFTENSIRDKKVSDIAKKVKIIASIPPDKPLGTELEVIMKNGAKFSTSIDVPRGDSNYNPLTENEIKDKFRENVAFSKKISEKKGAKVLKMLESLEKLDNLTKVINEII